MSNPNKNNNSKQVIVFGATGAVGTHLIQILSKEQPQWKIFAVTRDCSFGNRFLKLANVQVVQGDVFNKKQVMKLSMDKDIVYSCVGFPRYERKYWAKHWPMTIDNLLAASSQRPGQKFVFCDNLYAYGATTNISPSTKTVAPSKKSKPAIRALIRMKLRERIARDPSSITIVGGSDFFGPLVTNSSFLGDTFTRAIVKGKPAPICIGSAHAVHDFCYVPDFSKALYIASVNDNAYGKFWICPHSIHGKTMQQIANDIALLSNSKNSKVTAYSGWVIRMLSPAMSFMAEMKEMLPFWTRDYTIDDSDFCKTFQVQATPYKESLESYIDFYGDVVLPNPACQ